jgi:hypothetical protein
VRPAAPSFLLACTASSCTLETAARACILCTRTSATSLLSGRLGGMASLELDSPKSRCRVQTDTAPAQVAGLPHIPFWCCCPNRAWGDELVDMVGLPRAYSVMHASASNWPWSKAANENPPRHTQGTSCRSRASFTHLPENRRINAWRDRSRERPAS